MSMSEGAPEIDRLVEASESTLLGSMAVMLYSVPQEAARRVDAIAVYPGLGEYWRVTSAVNAWDDSNSRARSLLVAGVFYDGETLDPLTGGEASGPITVERLQQEPTNLQRTDGVCIQQNARHTREQADWLIGRVSEKNTASVALHVSPYHLLRAYLTTVKAFARNGVDPVPIIPVPVRVAPSMVIPETGNTGWGSFPGEAARIERYQESGDIANHEQLRRYIDWLWEQPIVAES